MGQGGSIGIVNGTSYAWMQDYIHSYWMPPWNYPTVMGAETSARTSVYVDFGEGSVRKRSVNDGRKVLPGVFDTFSSRNQVSWMQANRKIIGGRTLKQICIPGSHDAGMSVMNGGTTFATPENTLAQGLNIGDQLVAGARYFDIRPVISGGQFMTGHYSYVDEVFQTQGANGEYIDDIISEINAFLAQNAELVILKLSHTFDTDIGRTYPEFTQAQWEQLFSKLLSINNRYITGTSSTSITNLTINDFIYPAGSAVPAVIIIADVASNWITDNYSNDGIYPLSTLNLYDEYSNSDSTKTTVADQLQKMRDNSSQYYFLLSWTLTLQPDDIVLGKSIQDLAEMINPLLYSQLTLSVTETVYPNIIFVDFLDSNVAPLAVTINTQIQQ